LKQDWDDKLNSSDRFYVVLSQDEPLYWLDCLVGVNHMRWVTANNDFRAIQSVYYVYEAVARLDEVLL